MTRDTYERALKAAAQIAFLSLVAGCGGATQGEGSETLTGEGAAENQAEALAKKASSCPSTRPTDKSCRAAIKAAYPNGDPDWYGEGTPRKPTSTSDAALAACCEQVFFKNGTNGGDPDLHDSGCCTVLKLSHSSVVGIACTPWGPPMPVAMPRRGLA
jgi:hypothetical protein